MLRGEGEVADDLIVFNGDEISDFSIGEAFFDFFRIGKFNPGGDFGEGVVFDINFFKGFLQ